MNESIVLDSPGEYPHVHLEPNTAGYERKRLLDRIKSLEQQASGHENIARGLRGEVNILKRQAGIAT